MGLDHRVACCPDGLMTDRHHDVRVLDCSIRDGGCCNEWRFDASLVRRTLAALSRAGVDWMEIGYRTSEACADRSRCGPWRFSDDDLLASIAAEHHIQLAVMMDHGKATADDLAPRSRSPVSMVRVACSARDTEAAIRTLHAAQDKGYDVMCNVMAVSTCTPQEVDHFLGLLHDSTVPNVALVDSYGALYPHHVRYLVRKYKNWLRPDQRLGVHVHNHQQMAFANTIAAVEEGATLVDATVLGIGRGAGNCPLELLLMWLDSPRYDVEPVLELVEEYAELQRELRFGYHVPYAIGGWLNDHPREAIAQVQDGERSVVEFYRQQTALRRRSRHHRPVVTEDASRAAK